MRTRSCCLVLFLWANVACTQTRAVADADVDRVHKSAILIDTHNDVTSFTVEGMDIGEPNPERHTDLARMKKGGMGAQFFAVYVAASYVDGNRAANRTLEMIDTVRHDIIGKYPNDFHFATSVADIREARKRGKIAALMGIEGGHAIEDSLRLLRAFYDLGIRYMTLTHSNSNNWADSSGDIEKPNNGLSPFGKQVVAEMNRLGMLVDISHVSDKTFWDVIETSKAPPFASHSSARALANIPRNMTDVMIVALAKKGGVVQINFGCEFLSQKSADASEQARPAFIAAMRELGEKYKNDPEKLRQARQEMFRSVRRDHPVVPATLEDVVAQIDHVAKIAGVDAVGIGSDFDGVGCVPTGLSDVSMWPSLTRALLEKGYSQQDILKIYGENTLRVMAAAEMVAAQWQGRTN
ncbi:MAG: dipeptidase [Bryobacterales bacterium]|nr:dipeptidase [Bryobacterales bacterium]